MRFLLLLFALCFCVSLNAQKVFKINPGQKISDIVPVSELYNFTEFHPGTILFKSGSYAKALMNYNILNETLEFINPKGDTLAVADEANIKQVTLNNHTYYYNKVYLKEIAQYGDLILAERIYFSISNREKIGAMGTATSSTVETNSTIHINNGVAKDLIVQEVVTLKKSSVLYIGNKYNYFLQVNKKNLQEMYDEKHKELSKYIKDNAVQYHSKEDIQNLMTHFNK